MEHKIGAGFGAGADIAMDAALGIGAPHMASVYKFECFDKYGNLKWTEEVHNTVVNAGLNDLLTQYFKASSYTASFFVGLKDAGSISASDTMSSHSGWTEDTTYSNSVRPTLILGSVSGQSVDNTASKATFNINATTAIYGAFVTTNSTKGGTAGTLYGAADFSVSRSVLSGDTLNISITLSASAS